jgi:catalase (peroxidase I)
MLLSPKIGKGQGQFVTSVKMVDFRAVCSDIVKLIEDNKSYEDGSIGPLLVRLAWHACGTFDLKTKTGGSDGATMRFYPEASDSANNGLDLARALLEPLKLKYPGISYGDLWTLAGVVAIRQMV